MGGRPGTGGAGLAGAAGLLKKNKKKTNKQTNKIEARIIRSGFSYFLISFLFFFKFDVFIIGRRGGAKKMSTN